MEDIAVQIFFLTNKRQIKKKKKKISPPLNNKMVATLLKLSIIYMTSFI